MAGHEEIVIINGHKFVKVDNMTTNGPTYTYEEALRLTGGQPTITVSWD